MPGDPLMMSHEAVQSVPPPAGSSADRTTVNELPRDASQQDLLKAALAARAAIMFSGKSGAPVASGIEADATTPKEPSYGLCRGATDVVEELPNELFEQYAEHRPCGKLDRYEAVGMLIGDVLGLPLVPARPFALALGKKAKARCSEIPDETKKAKVKAKARHDCADPAKAAADVLLVRVKLPLPTAEQCTTAPAPEPALEPVPEPEPAPSDMQRVTQLLEGKVEAAIACRAAGQLERYLVPEFDMDGEEMPIDDEERDVALVRYKYALQKLKAYLAPHDVPAWMWPECEVTTEGLRANEHNSFPCPCGGPGRCPLWPWQVQTVELGFCATRCPFMLEQTIACCDACGGPRFGWTR
jgi:hypothetical protein